MRRSTTFLAACLALAFCFSSLQAQEAMPYTFVGSDIISTDNGWTVSVTRLAPYELSGVVIGTHRYNDPDLPYSPVDLAVAWGPVAKPGAGTFTVTMGGRQLAYVWSSRDPSITERDVATHVSNNHIIPASPQVYAAVLAVETGDTIHMEGYLVDLDGYREEGSTLYRSHWGPSSLVRDDEGPGACEIFLVEVLSVNGEHAQPVEHTEQPVPTPVPSIPEPLQPAPARAGTVDVGRMGHALTAPAFLAWDSPSGAGIGESISPLPSIPGFLSLGLIAGMVPAGGMVLVRRIARL